MNLSCEPPAYGARVRRNSGDEPISAITDQIVSKEVTSNEGPVRGRGALRHFGERSRVEQNRALKDANQRAAGVSVEMSVDVLDGDCSSLR